MKCTMLPTDDLHDFTRREISLENKTKSVFVRGAGAAACRGSGVPWMAFGLSVILTRAALFMPGR